MSSTNVTASGAVLPATSWPVTTYPLGVDGEAPHRKVLELKLGAVGALSPAWTQPAVATSG